MKHTIDLQPFTVPNFVRPIAPRRMRQEGFVETQAIPLSELDAATLDAMCDEFKKAVFAKAGKAPNTASSQKENL